MNVAVFSAKPHDRQFLGQDAGSHELTFFESHLDHLTASLARGYSAVCVFVNDTLDERTLTLLAESGTTIVALRCAGFNNVDLQAADRLGITVVRVPAYSPYAVAEHSMALILALNRKINRAHNRVREGNFSLEGLMGFDLHSATIGVVGTGHIGKVFCGIAKGFTDRVIAFDVSPSEECRNEGIEYAALDDLYARSDIVSLHCPLTPETHHMIDESSIKKMKPGIMLINTSRGPLVDTTSLIDGLKSGHVGAVGLDVYEEEADLFFEDLSNKVITDDVFARLTTFPNVIVTGHQAFFTREAMENIAATTLSNLSMLERSEACPHTVTVEKVR
jgi:D-lactate dehydrogenase